MEEHSPITIVSGLPRSGTSMVMQMLAAGGMDVLCDEQRPADANNPRGYLEDERVRALERDSSWLGEAEGKAVKIVSPLLGFLPTGFCYQVLFVQRPVGEVVASQTKMLERLGKSASKPVPGSRIEKAFRMSVANSLDLLRNRDNCSVLCIGFREILASPDQEAQRMAGFLAKPLDLEAMVATVEPSLSYRWKS